MVDLLFLFVSLTLLPASDNTQQGSVATYDTPIKWKQSIFPYFNVTVSQAGSDLFFWLNTAPLLWNHILTAIQITESLILEVTKK